MTAGRTTPTPTTTPKPRTRPGKKQLRKARKHTAKGDKQARLAKERAIAGLSTAKAQRKVTKHRAEARKHTVKSPKKEKFTRVKRKTVGAGVVGALAGTSQGRDIVAGTLTANPREAAPATVEAGMNMIGAGIGDLANVGISGGRAISTGANKAGIPGARKYTGKEIATPAKEAAAQFVEGNKQISDIYLGTNLSNQMIDPETGQEVKEGNTAKDGGPGVAWDVEFKGLSASERIKKFTEEQGGYTVPLMGALVTKPILPKGGVAASRSGAASMRAATTNTAKAAIEKRMVNSETRLSIKEKLALRAHGKGYGTRRPGDKTAPVWAWVDRKNQRVDEADRAARSDSVKKADIASSEMGKLTRPIRGWMMAERRKSIAVLGQTGAYGAAWGTAGSLSALKAMRSKIPNGSQNAADFDFIINNWDKLRGDTRLRAATEGYAAWDKSFRKAYRADKDDRYAVYQQAALAGDIAFPDNRIPVAARPYTQATSRAEAWLDLRQVKLKLSELRRKRVTERNQRTKKQHTADKKALRAEGSARGALGVGKYRVTRADRKILRQQEDYVAAVKEYNGAAKERSAAQKNFGNLARYPNKAPAAELAAAVKRKTAAEANFDRAKAARDSERKNVYARGEVEASKKANGAAHDAGLAKLGRGPRGATSRVENTRIKSEIAAREAAARMVETKRLRAERRAEIDALVVRRDGLQDGLRGYTDPSRPLPKDITNSKQRLYDDQLLTEYATETQDFIRGKGLSDPAWVRHTPSDMKKFEGKKSQYTGGVMGQAEKVRTAQLMMDGNVDYNYATLAKESIIRRAQHEHSFKAVRDFVFRNSIKLESSKSMRVGGPEKKTSMWVSDGTDITAAFNRGDMHPDSVDVLSAQEFSKAFRHNRTGDPDAVSTYVDPLTGESRTITRAEFEESVLKDLAVRTKAGEDRLQSGTNYIVVPRERLKEFKEQLGVTDGGKMEWAGRWARKAQHFQSRALLGTSPAWAAAQFIAEGSQAAVAVNPYRLYRGWQALKELTPGEQRAFRAQMEAAPGGGLVKETNIGLRAGYTEEAAKALGAHGKSNAGKVLHSIATAEPLIAIDRWKANNLRTMVGAGHVDRELNSLLHNMARINTELPKHLEVMRKLPLKDQLRYFAERPREADRIAHYVKDTMGAWQSMTRYERALGPLTMFYPFLRFSLRWTFKSYPKRHPIKAAILLNLATTNSMEVRRLLGGDAPFLQKFAQVPLYTGEDGGADQMVSTARFIPSGNAMVEAGFSSATKDFAAFTRAFQPFLTAPALAMLTHDPRTGRPLTDAEKAGVLKGLFPRIQAAGATMLQVPTAARIADSVIKGDQLGRYSVPVLGGREDRPVSRLFNELQGEGQGLRSFGLPFLPQDAKRERRQMRVGNALKTSHNAPSDEEISVVIAELVEDGVDPADAEQDPRVKAMRLRQKRATAAGKVIRRQLARSGLTDEEIQEKYSDLAGPVFSNVTGKIKIPAPESKPGSPWAASRSESANPWARKAGNPWGQ